MDLLVLGEFVGGERVLRGVAGIERNISELVGRTDPRDMTYCGLAADGKIGPAVPDTLADPVTRALPVTHELGVRSYVGVPIRLTGGRVYGTLCCFRYQPDPDISPADLGLVTVVAGLIAQRIEEEREADVLASAAREQISALIDGGQPRMVFQPIIDLARGTVSAVEALSRFDGDPPEGPDVWFARADEAGCGPKLEAAAVRSSLSWMAELPETLVMNINVGAGALSDGLVQQELLGAPLERVVLEVTEQNLIEHPDESEDFLSRARELGAKVAIDDLGAGYAGLHRILDLRPDVIKLDRRMVSGLDQDPVKYALVGSTASFAASTGATVVAEGVEHEPELEALRSLAVSHAQGYHLGRPSTAPWRELPADHRVIPERS
jgi:EAL domain-containing protein (putative c-di-GMP-specific phosphodiesterase class I)